jgi:hypothetical protein
VVPPSRRHGRPSIPGLAGLMRRHLRADAAFAMPEVNEFLE